MTRRLREFRGGRERVVHEPRERLAGNIAAMRCARCGALLSTSASFCGHCGEPSPAPVERPEAVASYREAMTTFLAGGVLQDWAARELEVLRGELGIHPGTHERLLVELSPRAPVPAPVSLEIDAASLRHFTAGAQCLLVLRVCNEGQRAVKAVRLECVSTALAAPVERRSHALGPGLAEELTITLQPALAGQHQLHVLLTVVDMRDEEVTLRSSAASFVVARGDAGPSTFVTQIDAGSLRVGTFDNLRIGAGAEPAGGLLSEHDWHPLSLAVVSAAAVSALRREWGLPSAVRRPPAQEPQGARGARSADAGRRKVDLWNELLDLQGRVAAAGSRRTPEVASLHHRCAELHELLGNKEQALAAYEKAWSIEPTRPARRMALALCCQRRGEASRAEEHLRALLAVPLEPAAGVAVADVHCALAELLLRRGDRGRAHEEVLLALADDPRHPQALKLRGQTAGSPK